ncbi:MAG TPA: alpha/beta hydrolase [Spongiibacteraceae bacterium]|nr:alpha/beta hydrolase [Spongiibacteraceae bacterium]
MTQVTENYYFSSDGLRLFYRDFAASRINAGTVICLHGLTRNSRDFVELAEHLQPHYRVIAPDLRGRGQSECDPHWQNYHPGTYVRDVFTLLDTLKIERVAIIGTSLGALMAMLMSAQPFLDEQQPQRIAGIVLNDAGPEIDPRGLARIAQYAGNTPVVNSWQDAARYVESIYKDAFPDKSEQQWLAYARLSYRENKEGNPVPDCDPNIGAAFRDPPTAPQNLWPVFAQLTTTPTLVIRGEHSDILSEATVQRMAREKPDLQSIVVPNRGHAPQLNEPVCVTAIDRFLAELEF